MSPRIAIAAAALLLSTGGAAVKLSGLSAAQLSVGRAAIAGVVLFVLFPAARRRWSRDVWIAGAAYAATSGLFVFANTLTTAGNAIFIQNVAPVWVLLVAPKLLGEASTFAERLTLPISLFGCALFFFDDASAGSSTGNVLALLASFSYATLLLFYRRLDATGGIAATICGCGIVSVVLLPASFGGPTPTLDDAVVVLYLGAVQQAGGFLLYVRGIRGVSALEGALLLYLEPVLSPLWAYLAIGERLTPPALAGGALIIGAALWRTWYARSPPRESAT